MSIAKKLVGQTAAYGISSIVGRALNYLLVPIYTAIFVPAEYGVVGYLYALAGFFNILYTYGMETAFFRFASKPGADQKKLYNQVLSLIICSSLAFTTVLLLTSGSVVEFKGYAAEFKSYINWLALVLAIDAIVAIPFAWLRLKNKAIKFASIKFINILITVGANMFFLVLCRDIYQGEYLQTLRPLVEDIYSPTFGIGYIFLINLVANALLIPMLWREFSIFRFELNKELLRPMLVYAYPLLFMGIAGAINELLDRILLEEWLPESFYPNISNLAAVGIYNACYKLSIFMTLAIQAFRYAAEPFFFSQAEDKNSPQTFALVMKWFVIACAFIFLFVSANLEDFALLLRNPAYREGILVVPVLLLANLFLGVYYNLSVWFKLTDKTKYGTYISFGGAAVTIAFNLLLIPVLGYMGSAIATFICYFSMALASYLLGNKHYPIPYPVKTIVGYILLAAGLAWIALEADLENFWLRHAFRLALCAAFVVVVWLREHPRFLKF
ncbi:O-antigen/teichoic acid export membrane protein [Pontibacter ummariensis]|uniref:Membrane protein involved in the export of O-antigen and teichoic acid n=1 Tax=Pontibacter ummariensis TaxID=1610492 RepID=A0A239HVZ8_9BACT|nr:polysaccharide biosynthesis C-terminal domain-containing protein [Pontibacter ummariensis]PRY10419.1 O-antigen/teichoic acid export membrane protein [Pontibacter ummariensis]SNS84354.1 Membrane protein involved in the export of O-antigen and teichoic acid [Pontibacter ummariensis]